MAVREEDYKGFLAFLQIELGTFGMELLNKATRTCITCHFFKDEKRCMQGGKDNGLPPPRIIAFGCKYYLNETDIPF